MPYSFSTSLKSLLAYWLPLSLWKISPFCLSGYLPYPNAKKPASLEGELARDLDNLLFELRENAAAAFVHDNADLLARDRQEGFEKTHWVTFDGQRLLDLPEDAAPEWLEAAKELALAVLAHQSDHKSGYVEEYKRTQAKQFATAQKVCRQFLERFKLISTNPYERATRAAELLREAQALGLNLTEPDGSAMRTSA